jgi:hypothetical protein
MQKAWQTGTVAAMHRVAATCLLCLFVTACEKKQSSSGLAPASEWKAGSAAPPSDPPPANPHGGDNPHAGNPHAGNPHGGDNPHAGAPHAGMGGAMPEPVAAKTLDKAGGRSLLGPFTVDVPKDWTEKPVTSSMRAAHFVLPGKAGEAELVVYYFGEGGAGGVDANLERWLGQFTQPDGKASKDVAKIEKTKVAGQDTTTIAVTGRYTTSQMPGGPPPVDVADGMLLGAIVESPKGPYYFKLTGPKATVDGHAGKFRAMLASMKL